MQTIFDADVASVETEVPVTFKFNGATFTGSRTPTLDKQAMMDAGFEQAFDFKLVVRVQAFSPNPPMPVRSDIIILEPNTLTWTSYHCQSATPSQDGVTVTYNVVQMT